jgi:hypothetical protein
MQQHTVSMLLVLPLHLAYVVMLQHTMYTMLIVVDCVRYVFGSIDYYQAFT